MSSPSSAGFAPELARAPEGYPKYRPGTWCDVAVWIDGRLLHLTADGPKVRCYLEDALIWEWTAPEALLFCRAAVQGNVIVTAHQGHQTGHAWLVGAWIHGTGFAQDLGPTFGVQPVGLDAHEACVVRSSSTYDRCGLLTQPFPSGAPGSSQGLSDVQPDGTLWWADQHRTLVIGGTVFTYPNVRGPVTVGQVDPAGIAAAVGRKITRVLEGDAFEPHVAVSPNGRVAICARTPVGAAYVATTLQELSV